MMTLIINLTSNLRCPKYYLQFDTYINFDLDLDIILTTNFSRNFIRARYHRQFQQTLHIDFDFDLTMTLKINITKKVIYALCFLQF